MNTKLILAILFLGIISLGSSCCKKDNPQPSSPKEKYNYFAAKVDGKAWKACGPITAPPAVGGQYFENQYFDIDATSCNSDISEIYLKIYNLNDTGSYVLGGTTLNLGECKKYYGNQAMHIVYKTDSIHSGTVIVNKFDTATRKISGLFEFQAFSSDSNKIVSIKEGEFINVNFYKF